MRQALDQAIADRIARGGKNDRDRFRGALCGNHLRVACGQNEIDRPPREFGSDFADALNAAAGPSGFKQDVAVRGPAELGKAKREHVDARSVELFGIGAEATDRWSGGSLRLRGRRKRGRARQPRNERSPPHAAPKREPHRSGRLHRCQRENRATSSTCGVWRN
jgi:hypothetical protein